MTNATSSTTEFLSELPPHFAKSRGKKADKFKPLYESLVANPNQWTLLRTYPDTFKGSASARTYVQNCKQGRTALLSPAVGVEVVWIKSVTEYEVYVRYVGADNITE
jgi:hypothetical protein